MNSNEKVSVLDYNNFIRYKSNAIIKFISEDNNFLIPADIKVNALVNQWIDWASFVFGVPCQLLTAHMAHLPLEERDPKKVIEAINIINKMLKVLDVQLCKFSYLVGITLVWQISQQVVGLIDTEILKLTCHPLKVLQAGPRNFMIEKRFSQLLLSHLFSQIKECLIYFIYSTNHSKNWSCCNASTYPTAKNRSLSIFNLKFYISCGFCF